MQASGFCPHCGGPTYVEYDGPNKIIPETCEECGAWEMRYDDGVAASDEELFVGWWMGDGDSTCVVLKPEDVRYVEHRRQELLAERARRIKAEEERAVRAAARQAHDLELAAARQRYVDEALF